MTASIIQTQIQASIQVGWLMGHLLYARLCYRQGDHLIAVALTSPSLTVAITNNTTTLSYAISISWMRISVSAYSRATSALLTLAARS